MPESQDALTPVVVPLAEIDDASAKEVLRHGAIEPIGRLPWSSNNAFLCAVSHNGVDLGAVYKLARGERPLRDFPTGTLYAREVAAHELSEQLGLGIVPPTVVRQGPMGEGALQRFVDHDPNDHYFTLLESHADRFREFAFFDLLANNADRKAGHCLFDRRSRQVVGIDHGLTFNTESKLRTVIWDFAGESIPGDLVARTANVAKQSEMLSAEEVKALRARIERVRAHPVFPHPPADYHAFPWPMI